MKRILVLAAMAALAIAPAPSFAAPKGQQAAMSKGAARSPQREAFCTATTGNSGLYAGWTACKRAPTTAGQSVYNSWDCYCN